MRRDRGRHRRVREKNEALWDRIAHLGLFMVSVGSVSLVAGVGVFLFGVLSGRETVVWVSLPFFVVCLSSLPPGMVFYFLSGQFLYGEQENPTDD